MARIGGCRWAVMTHQFRPGDKVIWWKNTGGGFAFPFIAQVVAATPKRVTISADDPDEKGEGNVIRHVSPASLQPRLEQRAQQRSPRAIARGAKRKGKRLPPDSFEARYPHVACWVQDGWIEIGHDDCGRPFLRAMDIGGTVWEGDEPYSCLDDALLALDAGIATWLKENG